MRHDFVAGESSDPIEKSALIVAQRMFENHGGNVRPELNPREAKKSAAILFGEDGLIVRRSAQSAPSPRDLTQNGSFA
jgi:hypothetical protein